MLLLILQVLAVVLLFLAAFNVPPPPRLHLGWLGLAIWFCVALLAGHVGGRLGP